MPKYRLNYETGASTSIVVEAADEDEAMEIAEREFDPPSLCAHCSGWGQKYSIDLGDWVPDDQYPIELVED